MAKSPKSNLKPVPATEDAVHLQPLSGVQKLAWWSVPAVGVVFLGCAATLGFLYVNKPTVATNDPPAVRSPGEELGTEFNASTTKVVEETSKRTPQATEEPKSETHFIASPAQTSQREVVVAEVPDDEPSTSSDKASKPSARSPAVTVSATPLMSLQCTPGKVKFDGEGELKFVDNRPSLEVIEEGDVSFAHLFFDGSDQSAELPPVPKEQGSLLIVAKMPARKTSIFLDSSYQRLTLRKNSSGLRWRIAGEQKPASIRLVGKKIDFNAWHHIVVTWKSGSDAILYVDGTEYDRYPYTNAQPHFPNYEEIVLGRTRGSGARYYECRVHNFAVYDQPITQEEVANLNQSVRETYPFIFK